MLTCYDATTADWLWRGGVRTLLVGDTAAQMMLGHDSTLPVSMDFMVEITRAARRGAPDALVMADMPFGSYQAGEDAAVANAIRFVKEADADAVKLEVDESFAPLVERMAHAGVPVVAHLGSRPQQVRAQGGYRAAGRTRAEAAQLIDAAELMIQRGASMLLLEAVPAEVSHVVVELAENPPRQREMVPVVGCGAGPACHGHVVVLHDLLGLTGWQPPFAKPIAQVGRQIQEAAARWNNLVRSGEYLKEDHPYGMKD
jgi:3-methyl-2-oxobutanoate hydroxymethyltransferase